MDSFKLYCVVGLGSALGGMSRFWFTGWVERRYGDSFPWGTILVNVSGSLLIGLCFALMGSHGRLSDSPRLSLFLMSGICGGYTTFSAFSLQTFNLARQGDLWQAGANVVLSVALCLAAVALGYWAGNLKGG